MKSDIRELKLEDCHDAFKNQSDIKQEFLEMLLDIEFLNKKLEKKNSDYRLKLGYSENTFFRYSIFVVRATTGKYAYTLSSSEYFSDFVRSFLYMLNVLALFEL